MNLFNLFCLRPMTTVPSLTHDNINVLQTIASQAVLSTESIAGARQEEKNQLAEELTLSILDDIGIVIPDSLLHMSIQAARYSVNQFRLEISRQVDHLERGMSIAQNARSRSPISREVDHSYRTMSISKH